MNSSIPPIRTRFAPSPTGLLHIGSVRTALFSWAFARKYANGEFILRIEDTDLERSTLEAVNVILQGLAWLGINYDKGPLYQMQRLSRYREVLQMMLDNGLAYYCYCTKEELEHMREIQRHKGEKPRYDGRWRNSKNLPPVGVKPVIRFKNPLSGVVAWDDQVKGRIEISNTELDDLVIARSDGVPTYNFCVVVDDWDMQITHVIRGDDHVNNTPRQINMLQALGAPIPCYAHLPMILREDGQKMSKRYDPVSVIDFAESGILPEALLNYLARLGWSHGNTELFSMKDFIQWFDLADISASAARFDKEKLYWLNQQYMKKIDNITLADQVTPFLRKRHNIEPSSHEPNLTQIVAVFKDRTYTLAELADAIVCFYRIIQIDENLRNMYLNEASCIYLHQLYTDLVNVDEWSAANLEKAIKDLALVIGISIAKIAMPLRVLLCGTLKTPSIGLILALMGKKTVLHRLERVIGPI